MTASKTTDDGTTYPAPGPLLIVLSGLSGVGKDTVLDCLKLSPLSLEFIVTMTTRPPRPHEIDGVHYRFVSSDVFKGLIQKNELLEWAEVYGNYYGPPKDTVRAALAAGKDVVVKVDVQGVATIKKLVPDCVAIFLATQTMAELEERLRKRKTESEADLELRLKTAERELKQLHLFDYIVFNHEGAVAKAAGDVEAIIVAEKHRVKPRRIVV